MRYTSYNMAVTALNARKSLSDFVERMWEYIEEGNIEKTECARNKALMLDALIATVERYHPTIQDAKTVTITGSIATSYPSNIILGPYFINGVQVSNQTMFYAETVTDIYDAIASAMNTYISRDNDVLSASAKVLGESIVITVIYKESLSPIDAIGVHGGYSSNAPLVPTTTYSEESDYEYPRTCLTEIQMQNIIEKIDELCECNC